MCIPLLLSHSPGTLNKVPSFNLEEWMYSTSSCPAPWINIRSLYMAFKSWSRNNGTVDSSEHSMVSSIKLTTSDNAIPEIQVFCEKNYQLVIHVPIGATKKYLFFFCHVQVNLDLSFRNFQRILIGIPCAQIFNGTRNNFKTYRYRRLLKFFIGPWLFGRPPLAYQIIINQWKIHICQVDSIVEFTQDMLVSIPLNDTSAWWQRIWNDKKMYQANSCKYT